MFWLYALLLLLRLLRLLRLLWTSISYPKSQTQIVLKLYQCSAITGTDSQTACNSYTWIDGQTYTESNNTATVTLTTAAGCDSVVTLDLTINSPSVSQNGATLTANIANNANAVYQWIDCDNGNAAIVGATSQVFTATTNGYYAVVTLENGCTDTSACVQVSSVSTTLIDGTDVVSVYPNPTTDNINIDFSSPQADIQLRIYDALGQLVLDKRYTQRDLIHVALPQLTGLYLLELQTDKGTAAFRVVKEWWRSEDSEIFLLTKNIYHPYISFILWFILKNIFINRYFK